MKLKAFLLPLIIALTMGMSSSCNSDSDDSTQMYANIVTLVASNEQGTVFTFRTQGDEPLVTLTSTQRISPEMFKVGSRVLLHYYTSVPAGESGAIQIVGMANILGGGARLKEATASETENWRSENISVQLLYRTGEYIDLAFVSSAANVDKNFQFYVDKTTLGSDYPECHIVLSGNTGSGNNALYYGSYSIDNIWNLPNVKGIKIHLPDNSQQNRVVTVEKNNTIKPVEPAQ